MICGLSTSSRRTDSLANPFTPDQLSNAWFYRKTCSYYDQSAVALMVVLFLIVF